MNKLPLAARASAPPVGSTTAGAADEVAPDPAGAIGARLPSRAERKRPPDRAQSTTNEAAPARRRIPAVVVAVVVVIAGAGPALGQEPPIDPTGMPAPIEATEPAEPPAPIEPTEPPADPTEAPSAPSEVAAPPPPPPAPADPMPPTTTTTTTTTTPRVHDAGAYAAPALAIPVRVYGTIKPTLVLSNGLESFGFQTLGATTAAAHPVFDAEPGAARLSFQIMQTRFGIKVGEGTPVTGILELDFIHFEQSSPVQQAFPRLRLAVVEWTPGEGHKLFVGQTWDLFSPLGPHTFGLVQASYQAGNSGFLRNQLGWIETTGVVEIGAAIGLLAPNATPNQNFVELGLTPTFAVRSAWKPTKTVQLGVSAIGTNLNLSDDVDRLAWGGNVFADVTFASLVELNLRAEGYGGANLANLGALTLAQGHVGADVYEAGGFVSTRLPLADFAIFGTVAAATVLNPDDMKLGYLPAHDDVTALRVAANGAGLSSNGTVRVGGSYSPLKGFSLIAEPFAFVSTHRLHDDDDFDPLRLGFGVEAGALYVF